MRAITCTGYGPPTDVLRAGDVDEPTPAEDEVLVAVRAAALNPADWHLIRGMPYLARLEVGLRRPPFEVPGSDFAGVVEAVGSAGSTVRPGDEVFGTTFMAGFGALAERVAVAERRVAVRPRNTSFEESAAVPLAASTALQALRDHGGVRPGQRVLIIGASGGVGTYAVQLAKHFGAIVTAVCSTPNLRLVRSLGADHVVDSTVQDVTATSERYDLVVQAAGTAGPSRLRRLLEPDGTLVQLSGDSPNRWLGPLGRVIAGRLLSLTPGPSIEVFTVAPNCEDLDLLADLLREGALTTRLERTYAFEDVIEAMAHVESGRARGKVAVTIGPQGTDAPSTHGAARSPR